MGLGAVTHSEGVYCIPDNPSIWRNDGIKTSNYQCLCHGRIPAPPLRPEKKHHKRDEVCCWMCSPGCSWTSAPSLSQLPAKQLIPDAKVWETGLDHNSAQGFSTAGRGNDGAKDKHKGFRLPLKDDLAKNKQTAVAEEGTWKVDESSVGEENVCGRKKAFKRSENYVLWRQAKTSSCIWSVTLLKEM